MPQFLDEINGGFVVHTKANTSIAAIVSGRIYPEVAPMNIVHPHIVYTQVDGNRIKTHNGLDTCSRIVLHVYAISNSQPQANQLAKLIEDLWLAVDHVTVAGTLIQVANGGTYDGGQWFAKDSSDQHLFYRRLVLKMLIG